MRTIVIMNETHKLMDEQHKLLEVFGEYDILSVPKAGWTIDDMNNLDIDIDDRIVFVSPVPYLLAKLSKRGYEVYLFHNDNRHKVELPDGKVIFRIPEKGWKLIKI